MSLQLQFNLISSLERVEGNLLPLPSKIGLVFSEAINQATARMQHDKSHHLRLTLIRSLLKLSEGGVLPS